MLRGTKKPGFLFGLMIVVFSICGGPDDSIGVERERQDVSTPTLLESEVSLADNVGRGRAARRLITGTLIPDDLNQAIDQALLLDTDRIMAAHHSDKLDGSRHLLDHKDEQQREFIKRRLRSVGKTENNAPDLWQRLMSTRGSESDLDTDCEHPLSVSQDPIDPTRWTARVITSCFDGTDHSYVDLFWWNTDDGEIIQYAYTEDFDSGTDLELSIHADEALIGSTIQVDSMAISSRGSQDTYGLNQIIQNRDPNHPLRLDNIFDPSDHNHDDRVTICLERGDSNCDYFYSGASGHALLPVNTTFRFPAVVNDVIKVTAQVHLKNSGGVCSTQDLSRYASTRGAMVQINTNDPVDFGDRCVRDQKEVRFWIQVIAATSTGVYQVFWANDTQNHPIHFPIQFSGGILDTFEGGDAAGWQGNTAWTTVEVRSSGGNPGEYLHCSGTGGYSGSKNQTLSHTDFSQADQVEISFDLRYLTTNFTQLYLRFRYLDSRYNGWRLPLSRSFEAGSWHSYRIGFDPAWTDSQAMAQGWIRESRSASFVETMADVYTAEIRLMGSGEVGIDNYRAVKL